MNLDESMIPEWADCEMISRGLGFEVPGLNSVIWSYFVSQFRQYQITPSQQKFYFSHLLEELIRDGSIDRARVELKHNATPTNFTNPPPKQSALEVFEEKVRNYLGEDFADFSNTPIEQIAPTTKEQLPAKSIELEIISLAYHALKSGDVDEKNHAIHEIEQYFMVTNKLYP